MSHLGKAYERVREENHFCREATFFSTNEVIFYLSQAGFGKFEFRQTIFRDPAEMKETDPAETGYGEGSFVVVRGEKIIESQDST